MLNNFLLNFDFTNPALFLRSLRFNSHVKNLSKDPKFDSKSLTRLSDDDFSSYVINNYVTDTLVTVLLGREI